MPLHDQDIKYIAKKLSIPLKLVYKITEEEKDTELLLHETSIKAISKEDVLKLTFFTYIKLVVYRYSYDSGFSIEDKTYIVKIIYYYYLDIKRGLNSKIIGSSGRSEQKSQYLLLLAGLFYDIVPNQLFFPGYKNFIAEGFMKKMELRNIGKNIEIWIDVLREIKKKGWLDPIGRS